MSDAIEGKKAPAFTLADGAGKKVELADLKGKPVVVYFYPKDDTPGCTVEANEFQAHLKDFEKAGAVILNQPGFMRVSQEICRQIRSGLYAPGR